MQMMVLLSKGYSDHVENEYGLELLLQSTRYCMCFCFYLGFDIMDNDQKEKYFS